MKLQRSSGILLHPTSLPGPHGIGSFGMEAYRFVDFLAACGQTLWQILPLGPTGYGDSPYSAFSAFAGNPLLICLERLVEAGDLDPGDLENIPNPEEEICYGTVHGIKERLLHKAARHFRYHGVPQRRIAFEKFCAEQGYWVHDYALFRALRRHFGEQPWNRWPEPVRRRETEALEFWGGELQEPVFAEKYAQYVFFEQWFALKDFANRKGVRLMGDIPIFVALDSADVWANPQLFHLDEDHAPTLVAGVPPDYFSDTGQLWGNPLYRWDRMREDGFSWWLARFRWNLTQTDLVRIDHFRGFAACWSIDAGEETAVNGRWLPTPGDELFRTLGEELGAVPIVAEDLGVITPEVESLRDRFGFPGMKVLQFAFDSGPDNLYLPHNLPRNCLVYTGTHDNDTTLGWWQESDRSRREAVRRYLGTGSADMPWPLIRLAMASVADLCVFPLQDILGLGSQARMNRPGRPSGNWQWRFRADALDEKVRERLSELTHTYGRMPEGPVA